MILLLIIVVPFWGDFFYAFLAESNRSFKDTELSLKSYLSNGGKTMNKKTKKVNLFRKAVEYITMSRLRRTTLGISLCVGSFLYLIVLSDVTMQSSLLVNTLFLMDAFVFVLGVKVFTYNHDKFKRVMNRGCLEIAGLILAAISVRVIMNCLETSFVNITCVNQFLTFASVLYFSWYIIRLGRFSYRFINNILTKLFKLVRGKKMKNTTELIDVVLTNILSIAGTLMLIYQAMEPLLNKILGF